MTLSFGGGGRSSMVTLMQRKHMHIIENIHLPRKIMVAPCLVKIQLFVNSIWSSLAAQSLHGRWSWNMKWWFVITLPASCIVFQSPVVGFVFSSCSWLLLEQQSIICCGCLHVISSYLGWCLWALGLSFSSPWNVVQGNLLNGVPWPACYRSCPLAWLSFIQCTWSIHWKWLWQKEIRALGICFLSHSNVGNFVFPSDAEDMLLVVEMEAFQVGFFSYLAYVIQVLLA